MKRRHWANERERYYNRVLLPKEADSIRKAGAVLGLIFMLILAIGVIVALTGCAGKKFNPPKHTNETAQLSIPTKCIDQVVHGTENSKCTAVDGQPDMAVCDQVLVHFKCTISAVK